jgi:hypothetical protein
MNRRRFLGAARDSIALALLAKAGALPALAAVPVQGVTRTITGPVGMSPKRVIMVADDTAFGSIRSIHIRVQVVDFAKHLTVYTDEHGEVVPFTLPVPLWEEV